jgi:hypothetical protein
MNIPITAKRWLSLCLAICFLSGFCFVFTTLAEGNSSYVYASTNGDDLDSFVIDVNGVLTNYTGVGGDVVIPEGVVKIDDLVFCPIVEYNGKYKVNNYLSKIALPQSLVEIGEMCFLYQEHLTGSLILPDNLVTIGSAAFAYTGISGNLTLPNKLVAIGADAFSFTNISGELVIPLNFTDSLDGRQFQYNPALEKITILAREVTLGDAFANNSGLKSVVATGTLKSVTGATPGGYIFQNCVNLKDVSIPGYTGTLGRQAFDNTALELFDVPSGVTTLQGSSASVPGPFSKTKIKEIICPPGLSNIGAYTFAGDNNVEAVAILRKDSLTLNANGFRNTTVDKRVKSIYVYPGSDAITKLNANDYVNGNNSTIGIKMLTRTAQVTVQNPDAPNLIYANRALLTEWDDSKEYGFEEGIFPSFEPTALDALGAAITEQPELAAMFSGDTSGLVFSLNGIKYPFSAAGNISVNDGDKLHFFVEESKTFASFEYNGEPVTALTLAPGLDYTVSLKTEANPLANMPVYVANFGDVSTPWNPVSQQNAMTDVNGVIKLNFAENGEYILTAYDVTAQNGVAYNFLYVTVYAPDNGIKIELHTATPAFDTLTPMSSGYSAGAFVKLDDDGASLGEGFDPEHTKYRLYVHKDTAVVTLPLELNALTYASDLTLTAEHNGAAVDTHNTIKADSETGRFTNLVLTLPEGDSALSITTVCAENGEMFTRVYEIAIVRDSNMPYAGIHDLKSVFGQGTGKNTTLGGFRRDAMSYTVYINPGQEKGHLDATVNTGTEIYLDEKNTDGVLQTNEIARDENAGTATYRIEFNCGVGAAAPVIYTYRNDGDGERSMSYVLKFTRRSPNTGVYTPDEVTKFAPSADGQFLGWTASGAGALEAATYYFKFVGLGEYGGYVTYYYDDPIVNDPNNPYGVDFIVYGNSFQGGMCNEPAGAQVSYDGETWYDLAGQRYYELNTRYVQGAPLYNGKISIFDFEGGVTETLLINRTGDPGFNGGYPTNVAWGYADVASASQNKNAEVTWWVDAQPNNPYREGSLHHYENGGNVGDMFDLSWIVDRNGKPVDLATVLPNGIRYIKLQNVMDVKDNGAFGEISPEIGAVTRVNPANVSAAPVGVTAAPKVLTINGFTFKDFTGKQELGRNVTYYDLNLRGVGAELDVHVEGAGTDNIFVNMEPYYGGVADYKGALASAEDITRTVATVSAERARTVRIVVQNGEQEPRIYVIRCTNGGDVTDSASLHSLTLAEPMTATLAKDSGADIYRATVENYTASVALHVAALSPKATITLNGNAIPNNEPTALLPVTVGENKFEIVITSESGNETTKHTVIVTRKQGGGSTVTDPNNISVTFWLIGSTLSTDDVDLTGDDRAGYHGAEYRTWIPRATYSMPAGSKVYDLFVRLCRENGLDFRIGSQENYVEMITAPSKYGGYELEEFTNGNRSGWMYTVNGAHVRLGLSEQTMQNGDVIVWHYVNDYSYEVHDWFDDDPRFLARGDGSLHSLWLRADPGGTTIPDTTNSGGEAGKENETAEAETEPGGGKSTPPAPEVVAQKTVETTPVAPDDTGKATVEVKSEAVTVAVEEAKEAVAKAKAEGKTNAVAEVIIPIKTEAGATAKSVEADIPAEAIKAVAAAQDLILTIESDVSTITLDTATLTAIAETAKAGETIKIAAEAVDNAEVLNDRQREKVGDNPVIEVNISIGTTAITNLGGAVTVSIPYKPEADVATDDYDLLTVYYLDDDGNITEMKGAHYDAATGKITFATTHFSKFFISEWINPFDDIAKGEWFYKAARYAYSNALITGTTDTTFAPQSTLTRAMLITILARDAGIDTSGGDTWYSKAVQWGMSNGLTDGTNMNNPITREQFATLLFRYAKLQGKNTSQTSDYSAYIDAANVSDWAREAMAWAYATGLVTGRTATTLAPLGTANRAEAATLLQRYLENIT